MAEKRTIPANLVSEKTIVSRSGNYKLVIGQYKTKEGCWEYTKGSVYRISDDKLIIEISRNYPYFQHHFFVKDGQEYLQAGRTYMSQIFVNLDTEKVVYDNSDVQQGYCWSSITASPDGNTLAVIACIWGGPYELLFYDFTDPSKGPIDLKCDNNFDAGNADTYKWNADGTFLFENPSYENDWCSTHNRLEDECEDDSDCDIDECNTVEVTSYTLKRVGDEVVIIS